MLQVVHRDHRRNRTDAGLQVGEGAEPKVQALSTDQLAQRFAPAFPTPASQPVKLGLDPPRDTTSCWTQPLSNRRRDLALVPVGPSLQPSMNATRGPGAVALPLEEHATASRRIRWKRLVIVIGRDQHELVLAAGEQLAEQVANVDLRTSHLSGSERKQIYPDPHHFTGVDGVSTTWKASGTASSSN